MKALFPGIRSRVLVRRSALSAEAACRKLSDIAEELLPEAKLLAARRRRPRGDLDVDRVGEIDRVNFFDHPRIIEMESDDGPCGGLRPEKGAGGVERRHVIPGVTVESPDQRGFAIFGENAVFAVDAGERAEARFAAFKHIAMGASVGDAARQGDEGRRERKKLNQLHFLIPCRRALRSSPPSSKTAERPRCSPQS